MGRIKTLKDLLVDELGVETFERETVGQAGLASALILRQNPNRVAFIVVNLSVNTLYMAVRGLASATRGIRLGPSGGSLSVFYRDDLILPAREWQAIATAAASDYYVLEVLILGGEGKP